MNQNNIKPKSRLNEIVVQEYNNDEVLVYDLKANKAICLNKTAAMIWKACTGEKNIEELADVLSLHLNSEISINLINFALGQLKKENLLEGGFIMSANFKGMSRREVIKRIGLTSMAALPLVSSLTAPSALSAQSVCIVEGNNTCRCLESDAPNVDDSCGIGLGVPHNCNAGCTCRRSAASCNTRTVLGVSTCQGMCYA